MKVKKIGIIEIMRRIRLFPENKIKSTESFNTTNSTHRRTHCGTWLSHMTVSVIEFQAQNYTDFWLKLIDSKKLRLFQIRFWYLKMLHFSNIYWTEFHFLLKRYANYHLYINMKLLKKWTLDLKKSQIPVLVLKYSSYKTVFL